MTRMPARKPGLTFFRVCGDLAVHAPEGDWTVRLDPTEGLVFLCCEADTTRSQVAFLLEALGEADGASALERSLALLHRRGLLERAAERIA